MKLVLADRYAPAERICFSDPNESVKVGWRVSTGKVIWWATCSPARLDQMLSELRAEGVNLPMEDHRAA